MYDDFLPVVFFFYILTLVMTFSQLAEGALYSYISLSSTNELIF